jgi:hypothetical protein
MNEKANLDFIDIVDGMVEFNWPFGRITSTSRRRSLKLSDLSVCRTVIVLRIPLALVDTSTRFWVRRIPRAPRVIAVDGRGSIVHGSWGDNSAGRGGRGAEWGGDLDGVRIERIVGAFDAVSGGEESIESLDEIWITAEQR